MSSMVVIKCLQTTDKYKEGVVYVVRSDVAERLVNALPYSFEWENTSEDPYDPPVPEVD